MSPTITADQLDALFNPRGVLIAGASTHPGKFGFVSLHNLLAAGYAGGVYGTNLKGEQVLGITTVADTVLDLVAEMRSPHDVVALLTDACRSKAVSAEEILTAMGRRKRQRHRQLVKDVPADVTGGVESLLEHKYLVRVERPHGLPKGQRQVKAVAHGRPIRKDVEYDEFATVVELDGRFGHEGPGRHRDPV